MTLIGMWLTSRNSALVFADSEVYCPLTNRPRGHLKKLCTNSFAAAALAGDTIGLETVEYQMSVAKQMRELLDRLQTSLQDEQTRHALRSRVGKKVEWVCVVAGWSSREGQVTGHYLRQKDDFVPMPCDRFACPYLTDFENVCPNDAFDLIPFARRQMQWIQKEVPDAGDGRLSVASVRPGHVTTMEIFDFGEEAREERRAIVRKLELAHERLP